VLVASLPRDKLLELGGNRRRVEQFGGVGRTGIGRVLHTKRIAEPGRPVTFQIGRKTFFVS
jgi:hypothetical protein